MSYLLDTNILLRLARTTDPDYQLTLAAVARLNARGESLYISPQNLVEFRNGATRPVAMNGLGMTPADADMEMATMEKLFTLLPDNSAIHPKWKTLIAQVGPIGKQVHDTRLVAVCHTHSITHLLTFNVTDFVRFQNIHPGLIVVDPKHV